MTRHPNRRRPVIKKVAFTQDEWDRAYQLLCKARVAQGGALPFSTYARHLLLGARIVSVTVALDPATVRAQMARIGNNVNQIARKANTTNIVTRDDVAGVSAAQRELERLFLRMCRERDEAVATARRQHPAGRTASTAPASATIPAVERHR